jgi:hypothetical protein
MRVLSRASRRERLRRHREALVRWRDAYVRYLDAGPEAPRALLDDLNGATPDAAKALEAAKCEVGFPGGLAGFIVWAHDPKRPHAMRMHSTTLLMMIEHSIDWLDQTRLGKKSA